MGRKHVHVAITAGLAIALATNGFPTAAVAESLGIEKATTVDTAEQAEPENDQPGEPDQPEATEKGTAQLSPGDAPATADEGVERPQEDEFNVVTSTYLQRWVDAGQTLDVPLPKELRIEYSDGRFEDVPVTWTYQDYGMGTPKIEVVDSVAKSVAVGSYNFDTSVKGRTVSFYLHVMERSGEDTQEAIQSVEPVLETLYTTDYADSSTSYKPNNWVNVIMANGEQRSLEVAWEEVPRELYDGDEDAGEFTVSGVIEQYGNYPVKADVVVAVPREQRWYNDISTPAGVVPELPRDIEIEFSNGGSRPVNVNWDMPSDDAFSEPGVVYVKGSIPGSKFVPQVKVKVEAIQSISPLSDSHTLVGHPVSPYEYASVAFVDGTYGSVPIVWEPIEDSAFTTPGVIEAKGKLKGYGNEVTCKINVHDSVLNPIIEKRLSVGADPLSATTSEYFKLAEYNEQYFDVDWNRAQLEAIDFKQAGKHLVEGVIQNTDIHVQLSLSIVGIDRIETPELVKTLIGVMPQLPNEADVVYTDGVVERKWINWDPILPSKYAAEGSFNATGEVYLDNLGAMDVSCPVEVLKAQAPASIDAVTLVGRAPDLPDQVKVTMWDGTIVQSKVQWENADPNDFGKPGSFDVRGYLLGSNIEIVAHVQALGLKTDIVAEIGYYPGAPETIQVSSNLELENGDMVYVPGIKWDPFPDDLRNGVAGTYEVGGTIAESPIRVKALVTTGKLSNVWMSSDIIIPAGSELVLPTMVSGEIEGGHYVQEIPITWDAYEKNPQHNIVVTGYIAGYDEPVLANVHVVTDPKFQFSMMHIKRGFNATEQLPTMGQVYVETENGFTTSGDSCSVTWDTAGVNWGESGTISGVAHATEIGYAEDVPVTIEYKVLDDIKIIDGLERWTEPGVAPDLNNIGIEIEPGNTYYPWVEWESIDPSLYSKAGSTFKVEGRIAQMGFDVETTVHVADVVGIEIPESVSTSNGQYPSLPYEVPVHWSDGGTSMEDVSWNNVPGSAYKGEPGQTTTVYGAIRGPQGELRHQVSTKIVIVAPSTAYDNGELDVSTQAGVKPMLPSHVAARMSDDTISAATIVWDPIPAEKYQKPGTFEVTGRIEGYAAARGFRLFDFGGSDINVAPDGTVTATVTVRPEDSASVPLQPETLTVAVTQGSDADSVLPEKIPVFMSDTGKLAVPPQDAWRDVNWDTSTLKLDRPGSYRVIGSIRGFDELQAVAYVNVLPKPRMVQSVAPLELTVAAGSDPSDVDANLLREAKVTYDDGSEGVVEVEAWDMTPITLDALKQEGDIEIVGRLVGSKVKATAVVHVVSDPTQIPVKVLPLDVLEIREGSKLSALIEKLPTKVTVEMKDGGSRDFEVTWDAPSALGKAGSEQVVTGITSNGLKVELTVVVTDRSAATDIVVSGEGVDDGAAVLKLGDSLKLSFAVEPAGAETSVTWSSSDEAVVTVSTNGVVTAVGAGTATVTVTSKTSPAVSASVDVTVPGAPVDPEDPSKVPDHVEALEPVTVYEGSSPEQVVSELPSKVTIVMKDGETKREVSVSWDEVPPLGAAGSSVLATGTAGGLPVQVTVNVVARPEITALSIYGDGVKDGKVTLEKDDTLDLKVDVEPNDAFGELIWSSSDEAVASVDSKGSVKALTGGKAIVTVVLKSDPEVSASVEVTVSTAPVTPKPPIPVDPGASTDDELSDSGKKDEEGKKSEGLAATGDFSALAPGMLGASGLGALLAGFLGRRRKRE